MESLGVGSCMLGKSMWNTYYVPGTVLSSKQGGDQAFMQDTLDQ